MDTKLKADIAELSVTKELLNRGFNVLKPIGDRLAYDLAIDLNGELLRIQIKAAWYNDNKAMFIVDNRVPGQIGALCNGNIIIMGTLILP